MEGVLFRLQRQFRPLMNLFMTLPGLCEAKSLSCVRHFATPWTVACQAPLSTGFSRQEYWSGLPFPSPGDLPDPGIKLCLLRLLHWQAGSLPLVPPGELLSWAERHFSSP